MKRLGYVRINTKAQLRNAFTTTKPPVDLAGHREHYPFFKEQDNILGKISDGVLIWQKVVTLKNGSRSLDWLLSIQGGVGGWGVAAATCGCRSSQRGVALYRPSIN